MSMGWTSSARYLKHLHGPRFAHILTLLRWQELFGPVVERLGYEYNANDALDVDELRTLAITQAADAGHEGYTLDYFVVKRPC